MREWGEAEENINHYSSYDPEREGFHLCSNYHIYKVNKT